MKTVGEIIKLLQDFGDSTPVVLRHFWDDTEYTDYELSEFGCPGDKVVLIAAKEFPRTTSLSVGEEQA